MHIPFIKQLFQGAINVVDHVSNIDVINAIKNNNVTYIEQWLCSGGNPRIRCGEEFFDTFLGGRTSKYTLLNYAIRYKNSNIVELLVQYGADVNSAEMEKTPLAEAISMHQFKIADYLLAHNADINGRGYISQSIYNGSTALIYICKSSEYHWAEKYSRLPSVKYLVNKGANIYIEDTVGYTALAYAINNNDAETVRYLVDKTDEASLNKFYNGKTLLQYLCGYFEGGVQSEENSRNAIQILDILLSRGVDVNISHPKRRATVLSILEESAINNTDMKKEIQIAIKMLKGRGAHL